VSNEIELSLLSEGDAVTSNQRIRPETPVPRVSTEISSSFCYADQSRRSTAAANRPP